MRVWTTGNCTLPASLVGALALAVVLSLPGFAAAAQKKAQPGRPASTAAAPAPRVADELDVQFAALSEDIKDRPRMARIAHQFAHAQAGIWETDRDPADVVFRRTAALLAELKRTSAAPRLAPQQQQLEGLKQAVAQTPVGDVQARRDLFRKVCQVRRQIAFANPLLNFDEMLLLKRHRATFNHMCDQFYGANAVSGGGLFVLSQPFSAKPEVRDLVAESVVTKGRLAGKKLTGGSFLSPDLSFDAKQLAFAHVECVGDTAHRYHTDPTRGHWNEGRCYHVFKMNLDGSGLEQLTDGTWNDFDPCWMPSGRLALITERRNGYLRCGRVCPSYTLFDMASDGTNMRCLSYHENNEWNPSVGHDGRILYTRWDYVDRHGCTAHSPWTTTVDGRDAREVHGNFALRIKRPDMEVDCRAIPGSHKFVATAAPHHGQAFGSLVIVDPRVPDDNVMAPVARLTPEVAFPETESGAQVYGTPWPLSEKFYLCAYDAAAPSLAFAQGQKYARGNYGIYLVDAFGNKELIYRDPEISCQNPVPVASRPIPPDTSLKAVERGKDQRFVAPSGPNNEPAEATVAVVNVYNSRLPWPADTKITALRVVQILPMAVPSGQPPHQTGVKIASANDSVNLARAVLGTAPVEADGSCHFTVPAHKEIYFQALDERGLAVQSMRSATYLHAGERLACAGCHESRNQAPQESAGLALKRAPSALKPDVEGSRPFSYARLVQPVLDQHCVSCHATHPKKPLSLAREPVVNKWFTSYANLTQKYGFWDYGNPVRTIPGQFGARASKLYKLLEAGHHDVKLSAEELHRISLWLDLSSNFYGVYEKEGGEAQLRGEVVQPTLE